MERTRGSYVDDLLALAMPMLEKILSMNVSEAVLNIEDELVLKIDKATQRSYDDICSYRNKDLIHELLFWWKQWKILKPILAAGWDIQAARSQALAGMTYLKAMAQIHEEIRTRLIQDKKLRYWPGTPMRASVRELLAELRVNRSATIKKLYQLIKQALLLEREYQKLEAVKDFFTTLAKADYKVAIPFLDVMGFEEREYKDLGILCILSRCPATHIKACIPLLTQFSGQDLLEEGLKTLFNNCYEDDAELAMMLIKKMPTRALRNQSLGELAKSYARKGDIDKSIQCSEMISSIVLKAQIDDEIKAFIPDNRPIFQVDNLLNNPS